MARSVELGPELEQKLAVVSRTVGVSGSAFVRAAVQAAITTCEQSDLSLADAIMAAGRARSDEVRSMGRRHALPVDAA